MELVLERAIAAHRDVVDDRPANGGVSRELGQVLPRQHECTPQISGSDGSQDLRLLALHASHGHAASTVWARNVLIMHGASTTALTPD